MSQTITVRLPEDLAHWIETSAARSGVSQGQIVREHLERACSADPKARRFMRLAGSVQGPRNLSQRKGFSKT
jgi:hypothetical protein